MKGADLGIKAAATEVSFWALLPRWPQSSPSFGILFHPQIRKEERKASRRVAAAHSGQGQTPRKESRLYFTPRGGNVGADSQEPQMLPRSGS